MSVIKDEKSGKWYVHGYVIIGDKKRWYKKRGFQKKSNALDYERKCRQELLEEKYSTSEIFFKDLVSEFLKGSKGNIKESTIEKYKSSLNKWNEYIGEYKLCNIDQELLQDVIDKFDNKYSKKYVSGLYYALSSCFEFAITKKHLKHNPIRNAKQSKRIDEKKKEMLFWEPEEFNIFISSVNDLMYRTFFMILFFMGVRKGEALALQWKDIDFEFNTININKTTSPKDRNKKIPYTTPKTKNSYRTITMPQILVKQLKLYNAECRNYYGYSKDSFVFGLDKPLATETIRRHYNYFFKKANHELKLSCEKNYQEYEPLKKIRIHDFRHPYVKPTTKKFITFFEAFRAAI